MTYRSTVAFAGIAGLGFVPAAAALILALLFVLLTLLPVSPLLR